MTALILDFKEIKKIKKANESISLPPVSKQHTRAVGCKGCEGGCAAEICATDRG